MLMIATGYEDDNEADDPAFKFALGRLPDGAVLCMQPTISGLANLRRPLRRPRGPSRAISGRGAEH